MDVTQLNYIRSQYADPTDPNSKPEDTFEGRLNTIITEDTMLLRMADHQFVFDDANEMLVVQPIKKQADGTTYYPIKLFIPYDRIMSIHMDNYAKLRDNMFQGNVDHWG